MVQIFLAHSSNDKWLTDWIASNLRDGGLTVYQAEYEDPSARPLFEKLQKAILASKAVFVILTPNVADNARTRDVVDFEITTAYNHKIPVYAFKEQSVEVPVIVQYTSTYHTFEMNRQSLEIAMKKMTNIGSQVKGSDDKATAALAVIIALLLGLVLIALGSWVIGQAQATG